MEGGVTYLVEMLVIILGGADPVMCSIFFDLLSPLYLF